MIKSVTTTATAAPGPQGPGLSKNQKRKLRRARKKQFQGPLNQGQSKENFINVSRQVAKQLKARNTNKIFRGKAGLSRFARMNDLTMQKSVHDILHSLFFSQHGVHRGLARGTTSSALTTYKGSFDVSMSNGACWTLSAVPMLITTDKMIVYNQGVYTNGTQNPYTSVVGINTSIPGPFNETNPSVGFRVVSFTLKLIPSGSALNQSGEGVIGYNPMIATTGSGGEWIRTAMDNLSYSLPWRGTEPMIVQWAPNDKETSFTNTAPTTIDNNSVIQIYLLATTGNTAFRVEWTAGIEYKPTTTFRPFVEKATPKCHPDSYYYVNQVLENHWDQLMISNYDSYREMALSLGLSGRNLYSVLGSAGGYKTSGMIGDADIEHEEHKINAEEYRQMHQKAETGIYQGLKPKEELGTLQKIGNAAYTTAKFTSDLACNVLEKVTPYSCNVDYVTPSGSMDLSTQLSQVDFDSGRNADRLNFLDLRFSNLPLDYLNGVLPTAQFGSESVVSLGQLGKGIVTGKQGGLS